MSYEPARASEIALRDGRTLAYCEWGDTTGRPIVLCHGAPASRLFAPDPTTTAQAGVRLISVDRPGYGRSDPKPGRHILDWPADVEDLTAALDVDEFDVAGHSSGGPYALVCAWAFPKRIRRAALVSCVAPFVSASGQDARDDDPLTPRAWDDVSRAAEEFGRSATWLVDTPEKFLDLPRPEPDVQLLTDPAIRTMFVDTVRESVEQGVDAYGWECAVERLPWGFSLEDVRATVWIFQGEQDRVVPTSQAHDLSARLPTSRLRLFPDAGHGLILAHWDEILRDLLSS
jgi:pimeloyl-ACP methyl ester carboxylesterase